jgi:hypothetical protein
MGILGRNVQVSDNGNTALVLEYAMSMYGETFIINTGGAKEDRKADSQEHTSNRK